MWVTIGHSSAAVLSLLLLASSGAFSTNPPPRPSGGGASFRPEHRPRRNVSPSFFFGVSTEISNMPPHENSSSSSPGGGSKRPRRTTLRSLSSLYSDDGSIISSPSPTALSAEKGGSSSSSSASSSAAAAAAAAAENPPSLPRVAVLAEEMNARADSMSPLLDSELDDAVHSLQNVFPSDSASDSSSPHGGGVDWDALRSLLSESAHLPHKEWDRTGSSATALRRILLGGNDDDDEGSSNPGGGLTDDFRAMFERVLTEGNWDGAASHASEEIRDNGGTNKPWAVLVTGVNGIRKTTSVYQEWFEELLTEALVRPDAPEGGGEGEQHEQQLKLPTGDNSFFRQLDHMIATLANEDFQRLYAYTDELAKSKTREGKKTPPGLLDRKEGEGDNDEGEDEEEEPPSAEVLSRYSDFKAAIFKRYRTLSEILGVLLVREAIELGSNVMIETSGRDVAMFKYVDANFPSSEYNKLALHFTIDDLSQAERSVDRRMAQELRRGIDALQSGAAAGADAREVIRANAGGPYGSEVLRGVQSDSDRVWEEEVMSGKAGVGGDWYKATIAVEARTDGPWVARAVRPDGTTSGKSFDFVPPRKV